MPKVVRLLVLALLAVFIASGLFLLRGKVGRGQESLPPTAPGASVTGAPRPGLEDLTIPEFTFPLVDHHGQPYTRDRLLGRLTIFSVVFTNCSLACPVMTEKMHALAEALSDTPVQFVSISIDPKRDTPARLREFRALHDIDAPHPRSSVPGGVGYKWTHLTSPDGSREYIKPIVEDGLKCALEEDLSSPIKASDGSDMYNIRHPTWFFLLDGRSGNIRVVDIYQSTSDEEMQRLERETRAMVR